ncbi:MAG: PocR ligand-binding domain-containing protein [Clostridia bacterium]|nr:PocR ligand-binding domain-containing protein [Clostridia bacterium]
MLQYNLQQLKSTIIDFYNITKIMIVLYDDQFKLVYAYPTKNNSFCSALRKSKPMLKKCLDCDRTALEYCKQQKRLFIYRCHFGLTEAIAPILENDTPIGYLMYGQTLTEIDMRQIRQNLENMPIDPSLNKEKLMESLDTVVTVSRETLTSAARILDMCATYLLSREIIRAQQPPLQLKIDQYIKDNISSPELTLSSICKHFSISRSTLYTISSQAWGLGISDYIRHCRIERAKKLLLKKSMPIYEVSQACGFNVANHFTKTFKQLVGIRPKEYVREYAEITDKKN